MSEAFVMTMSPSGRRRMQHLQNLGQKVARLAILASPRPIFFGGEDELAVQHTVDGNTGGKF
ncbi:hypothetical protein [Brevundimonas sp.]|uniref:hypothetical protein n=1 Tax=Brevundimonas sp. TaxID=1871086 RepID=UPI003AFFF506